MNEEELTHYLKGMDGNVVPFDPVKREQAKIIKSLIDEEVMGGFSVTLSPEPPEW